MNEDDNDELSIEALEPVRRVMDLQVGSLVDSNNTIYRISQILDFNSVIGIEVETGRSAPLRIGDLRPVIDADDTHDMANMDLDEITDKDWEIAESKFAIIKPLLNLTMFGKSEIEQRAKEAKVDPSSIYRWVRQYKAYGCVSALISRKRGWTYGKSRLPVHAEKVIDEVIESFYLTPQRPTAQKAVMEVLRRCHQRGIEAPGAIAIRLRLRRIPEKIRLRNRGYKEKARNKYSPAAGRFPNADFPLAAVQIDHTPVDIILVDDLYRKPIGRPWITLAMDVYSRVVTGYYLSFDPPSETSVAMCVAHSILTKEEWMILHKVDAEWPVWGVPGTIHADNAGEFRSNNFRRSCQAYSIHLEFRPVRRPRYGAHIERLLGTLLHEIHDLPGTTFSSIKEREGYDAEKNAAMTKSEFESWLVTLIAKHYHHKKHSGIGMRPLRQWEIGIFGNAEVQGIGLPSKTADRHTVLLDFLPSFRRTVQTFGVTIDDMTYYSEALRPWINMEDQETGKKRFLRFRRDPRDISSVFFFDPDLKQYYKIPFADQSLPAMSIWEYRQARQKLKLEGMDSANDHQILEAITELRSRVDESMERSKKARRQAQRRKEHEKKISPAAPLAGQPQMPTAPSSIPMSDMVDEDLEPIGVIS
ncbi:MAG: transposase [Deltaproteobacteria bacterium HGW-Deltaproteobacteria-6]|jgi:putative transposase|nr:MAG: transposase [Deltaproteobacteria bacterium HGW-Deltaproteobacteria-6]